MVKSQDQSLYLLHMLPVFPDSPRQLNAQHMLSDRLPSPLSHKGSMQQEWLRCLLLTLISLLYVSRQRQKQTFDFITLLRNKGNRLSSVSNLYWSKQTESRWAYRQAHGSSDQGQWRGGYLGSEALGFLCQLTLLRAHGMERLMSRVQR